MAKETTEHWITELLILFFYAIFQEAVRDKAASEKSSNHHLAASSDPLVLYTCSGHNSFVDCEVKQVEIPEL